LAILGLITPRIIILILWIFSSYIGRAIDSALWSILGFVFLPTTTLMYAVAQNSFDGLEGWGLVLFVLGVVVDFGLIGGGARARRRG
jgi:ABC-type Na+ efflux pump permease subunit